MTILGLDLEQYSRVRQYRGEYVFSGEDEGWKTLATIRCRGQVIGAGCTNNTLYNEEGFTGIRIVASDGTVLDHHADIAPAKGDYTEGLIDAPLIGFREYPFDCHVEPGARLEFYILDMESESILTARVFVVPDDDAVTPDVSVLGDGEHPGDPVAVMLTAIDSTLRLADHAADSED